MLQVFQPSHALGADIAKSRDGECPSPTRERDVKEAQEVGRDRLDAFGRQNADRVSHRTAPVPPIPCICHRRIEHALHDLRCDGIELIAEYPRGSAERDEARHARIADGLADERDVPWPDLPRALDVPKQGIGEFLHRPLVVLPVERCLQTFPDILGRSRIGQPEALAKQPHEVFGLFLEAGAEAASIGEADSNAETATGDHSKYERSGQGFARDQRLPIQGTGPGQVIGARQFQAMDLDRLGTELLWLLKTSGRLRIRKKQQLQFRIGNPTGLRHDAFTGSHPGSNSLFRSQRGALAPRVGGPIPDILIITHRAGRTTLAR